MSAFKCSRGSPIANPLAPPTRVPSGLGFSSKNVSPAWYSVMGMVTAIWKRFHKPTPAHASTESASEIRLARELVAFIDVES